MPTCCAPCSFCPLNMRGFCQGHSFRPAESLVSLRKLFQAGPPTKGVWVRVHTTALILFVQSTIMFLQVWSANKPFYHIHELLSTNTVESRDYVPTLCMLAKVGRGLIRGMLTFPYDNHYQPPRGRAIFALSLSLAIWWAKPRVKRQPT